MVQWVHRDLCSNRYAGHKILHVVCAALWFGQQRSRVVRCGVLWGLLSRGRMRISVGKCPACRGFVIVSCPGNWMIAGPIEDQQPKLRPDSSPRDSRTAPDLPRTPHRTCREAARTRAPDLVANWGLSTLNRLLGHLCVRMSWVWLSASTCGTAQAPRTLTRTQSGRQVSAGPPNCCRPTVDVQFCTSTLYGNRSEKGVKVEP